MSSSLHSKMAIWYTKKKHDLMKKFYKNCDLKTSSRPFCVCKELTASSIGRIELLKQATYIRHVIEKLSKFVQISM